MRISRPEHKITRSKREKVGNGMALEWAGCTNSVPGSRFPIHSNDLGETHPRRSSLLFLIYTYIKQSVQERLSPLFLHTVKKIPRLGRC